MSSSSRSRRTGGPVPPTPRRVRAAAVPVVLVVLGALSGCGAGADAARPADTATPTTEAAVTSTPPTTEPGPTATPAPAPRAAPPTQRPPKVDAASPGQVRLLPWPTSAAARLQTAADNGSDPWLLDPVDLALSYVSATYPWTAKDAVPVAGGTPARTAVAVTGTDGSRRRLTVAQPGRKGDGGIWLVTADTTG